MPNTRPLLRNADTTRKRPAPLEPQGSVGRALAARLEADTRAPLPARIAELLARLNLRAAEPPAR